VASSAHLGSSDFSQLTAVAEKLAIDYVDPVSNPWQGSPFAWIQTRPPRQKGAIGESLVAGWAASVNFSVGRPANSEADRIINGWRVEIKYSNLWTDTGIYKFQQIRDQSYDFVFCLGLSPFEVHAWFIPKSEVMRDRPPELVPQHGGTAGRDTRWLSFPASNPPSWLSPFGGTLSQVRTLIEAAGKGSHAGRPDVRWVR